MHGRSWRDRHVEPFVQVKVLVAVAPSYRMVFVGIAEILFECEWSILFRILRCDELRGCFHGQMQSRVEEKGERQTIVLSVHKGAVLHALVVAVAIHLQRENLIEIISFLSEILFMSHISIHYIMFAAIHANTGRPGSYLCYSVFLTT